MTSGMRTVVYPVSDLGAARSIYATLLGAAPTVDEPYYVGFTVDGHDLGLDPNGHSKGMTGPTGYWHVDDLRATLADLVAAGATTRQDVTDVGYGKLIATVVDPDGNVIGLLQEPAGAPG